MSSPFTLTIDWLAFTLPSGSAQDTMQMVGGDWTKSDTGFRGYPASWITASAGRGIGKLGTRAPTCSPRSPCRSLRRNCRAVAGREGSHGPSNGFVKQEGHLTRLDCALDDRASCVPLSTIRQAIEAGQCVTRADRMQRISSRSFHKATPSGETLYLGSPQSQTLLRIYDKRLESQAKQREDWQDYGIRWELELKKDRAQVCGQVLSYLELLKHKYGSRSVETELVFPSEAQTRLYASNISGSLNLALEKVKMTDFHFHDLHHTCATRMVQGGVDLYKVQRLLGHKSPVMTQRYAHHYPDSLRDGIEVLDAGRGVSTNLHNLCLTIRVLSVSPLRPKDRAFKATFVLFPPPLVVLRTLFEPHSHGRARRSRFF